MWPPIENWSAPASLSTVTFTLSSTTLQRFNAMWARHHQEIIQLLFPGS